MRLPLHIESTAEQGSSAFPDLSYQRVAVASCLDRQKPWPPNVGRTAVDTRRVKLNRKTVENIWHIDCHWLPDCHRGTANEIYLINLMLDEWASALNCSRRNGAPLTSQIGWAKPTTEALKWTPHRGSSIQFYPSIQDCSLNVIMKILPKSSHHIDNCIVLS